MRRKLAVLTAALLMALSACGGSPGPAAPEKPDPLAAIEEGLADIDSGRIQVAIRAITPGERLVEFEMSGTFSAATSEKSLPIADLKYSNRSGIKPKDSSFIADGDRAWVVNERGTKEVEGEGLDKLRGGGDVAGLSALNPKTWFEGAPKERSGDPVDGEPTTSYSGDVDVVAVLEDLTRMSANLGAYVSDGISDAGGQKILAAAQNPSLEVAAGTKDRLLRTVRFSVDITGDPKPLGPVLRELAANRIEFELSVSEINQVVDPPKIPEGATV